MVSTTTSTTTPDRSSGSASTDVWRPGAIGLVSAAAANLALFAAARVSDVSFAVRYSPDAELTSVTSGHVALTTVGALVVGLACAAIVSRRLPWGLRAVQIAGAVIAVASVLMPISLDADVAAKLVLAAMHLVTGAAFVATIGRARTM